MKIVCAASVLYGREAFSTLGEVVVRPDREIGAADLRDADALVIRSKTTVNAKLLEGSRLRYVGTATAGFDHLDLPALEAAGVAWFAAAGCNAESVADWFSSVLLCLGERLALPLEGKTLAVVGVGQVGRRVVRRAEALGLRVLQNDPPRALAEQAPELRPLAEMLPEADIVSFHVPLTGEGPFATRGMVDGRLIEQLKAGVLFVNASRGEIVDEDDLLLALESGHVAHAALDVWANEPRIDARLVARVALGTPHIAGYAYDGKLRGTEMVYADLCRFLEVDPRWTADALRPAPRVPELALDPAGLTEQEALWEAVRRVYDVARDDADLRGAPATDEERAARFERLRKHYPERREFSRTTVRLPPGAEALAARLRGLGFGVAVV